MLRLTSPEKLGTTVIGTLIMSGDSVLSVEGDPYIPQDSVSIGSASLSGQASIQSKIRADILLAEGELRENASVSGLCRSSLLSDVQSLIMYDQASVKTSGKNAVTLARGGVLTLEGGSISGAEHAVSGSGSGIIRFSGEAQQNPPVLTADSGPVIDTDAFTLSIENLLSGCGAMLSANTSGSSFWLTGLNTQDVTVAMKDNVVPQYLSLSQACHVQVTGEPSSEVSPFISAQNTNLGTDTWIAPGQELTLSVGDFDRSAWMFDGWYNGDQKVGTEEVWTASFEQDTLLTAKLLPLYDLTVGFSTDGGLTVTDTSSYASWTSSPTALRAPEGTEYRLTAQLTDSTMVIQGWLDLTGQRQLSENENCALTLTRDTRLVLCLAERGVSRTWCIAGADGKGSVWIGDDTGCTSLDAAQGSTLTIHAKPSDTDGYVLDHWLVNGAIASGLDDDPLSCSFTMQEGLNRVTAVMRYDLVQVHAVTDGSDPAAELSLGEATGKDLSVILFSGQTVSMTALPNAGSSWTFACWKDADGQVVSEKQTFSYTPEANLTGKLQEFTFTACYSPYMVEISTASAGGGSVTGGGVYQYRQQLTLKAVPDEGYEFVRWTSGSEVLGTDNPLTCTADRSRTIVAEFTRKATDLTVTIQGDDNASVTIEGASSGGYRWWDAITLTPIAGGETTFFDHWEDIDADTVIPYAPYSFTLREPRRIRAVFKDKCHIQVAVSPISAEGYIRFSGDGWYIPGDVATVSATSLLGSDWYFDHWEQNGTWLSSDASLSVEAAEDVTLTAVMARKTDVQVTFSVSAGDGGSVSWDLEAPIDDAVSLPQHSKVTVSAEADAHYRFDHWERSDGTVISTEQDYGFWVHADTALKAVFVWDMVSIQLGVQGDAQAIFDLSASEPSA